MKKLIRAISNILKVSVHIAVVSFVLVLPLGYYPNSPDSSDFSIGLYGGTGQVASVIRDCAGTALRTEASSYKDVSGLASWRLGTSGGVTYVLGVRGGYWQAPDAQFVTSSTTSSPKLKLDFDYWNPHFSLEGSKVGVGIGVIFGQVPSSFDAYNNGFHELHISAHLRTGKRESAHFIASLAENTPLISGGGFLDFGLGYPVSKKVGMFTGMTFGFYDRPGFLQQARLRMNKRLDADISLRVGGAGDAFEGSAAGGLIYHIGN